MDGKIGNIAAVISTYHETIDRIQLEKKVVPILQVKKGRHPNGQTENFFC